MIDTEALRKKVIDLAIQGKLTEQLPSDGDAETLYAQILDHKSQLIKEGKIKKDKALPDIAADEIPFEVPDNWKWVYLAQIAVINGGYAFKSLDYTKEGTRVIRISDFNEKGFVNNSIIRHPYRDEFEQFLLDEGDIILCMTGGTVGKSLLIKSLPEKMMTNQRVATIKSCNVNPQYIYSVILSSHVQNLIQFSKNSTNDNISMNMIEKFCVPLPPEEEQQRIVKKINFLFETLNKIDDLQAKYSNDLAVLKGKIIDAGIRGKLTEQLPEDGDAEDLYAQILNQKSQLIKEGKIKKEKPLPDITADEIPFEIPKNWKWVRVSNIAYLTSGKPYEETEEGELYIKVSDMNLPENGIQITTSKHFVDKKNDGIIPVNSIIFPKRGGAIATNKKRMVLQNHVFVDLNTMGMTVIISDIFMFVKYWFETVKLDEIQNGTTIPQVNNKDIYPLILPLPPLAEQKRITKKIDELLQIIG